MAKDRPKPVHEEKIDDKFKPGTGLHPCPSCSKECDIEHRITEFAEFIYCTDCRMKFTRNRNLLVEDDYANDAGTIIETSREDRESRIRFRCYRCNTAGIDQDYRTHKKTAVNEDSTFTRIGTGLVGYDECSLVCPCGERHGGYLDIGEKVECECGRIFQLLENSVDM